MTVQHCKMGAQYVKFTLMISRKNLHITYPLNSYADAHTFVGGGRFYECFLGLLFATCLLCGHNSTLDLDALFGML